MPNKRVERVNKLIKEQVSQILLKNFEFPPGVLVTITRVEAANNLRDASVFISVMPDKELEGAFAFLNRKIYEIQGSLNRSLKMRPLPRIQFVKEKETAEAGRIEEILAQLKKEEK